MPASTGRHLTAPTQHGSGTENWRQRQVHNEAIVVPENIDAIRALAGRGDAAASIESTNRSLGVTSAFLPATTRPIVHVPGDVEHPALAAVRASHAGFAAVGFKGSEEPTGEETP